MIKRRKLNILMALAMAMTLMFGSTVCFAAETDDVAEAVEQERAVARMQSGTVTKSGSYSFTSKGVLISYTVNIDAKWDEGYYSEILSGSSLNPQIITCPNDGALYTATMSNGKVSNNTIIYTVTLFKNHKYCDSADLAFTVDEYGNVY